MTDDHPTTSQEIDLITLGPELAGKITEMDAEERFPGMYRLRLGFANGRGASIITGPGAFWFPPDGTFELAPLRKDGTIDGDRDEPPPLRRGTEAQIAEWALEIANLPPESEELE